MGDTLSIADGFSQSNSGSASDTNNHVSIVYARYSIVHNMGRHVNHSRVENPRVEVWDEALDAAGQRYS